MLRPRISSVDCRPIPSALKRRDRQRGGVGVAFAVAASVSLGLLATSCSAEDQSSANSVDGAVGSQPVGSATQPDRSADSSGANPTTGSVEADGVSSGEYLDPGTLDYVLASMRLSKPEDAAKLFEPSPDVQAVKKCMESAGFEYYVANETDGDPQFSMDPETYARTWGLGVSAQLLGTYPVTPADLPEMQYLESLSDSERAAYEATQKGCVDDAGIDLDAAYQQDLAMSDFSAAVEADPRVLEAMKEWSACMEQSGYQYADRDSMYAAFEQYGGDDFESQFELEKAVAVANLSCQPALQEVYRTVVVERFGEYQTLLQEPRAEPDAAG